MTADRPTTEPRTAAGRRLLSGPNMRRAYLSDILAIEAEAAQGAAPLDAERLYRAWWHEMWRQGSNPLQWEQLPPGKRDGWERIAAALSTPEMRR